MREVGIFENIEKIHHPPISLFWDFFFFAYWPLYCQGENCFFNFCTFVIPAHFLKYKIQYFFNIFVVHFFLPKTKYTLSGRQYFSVNPLLSNSKPEFDFCFSFHPKRDPLKSRRDHYVNISSKTSEFRNSIAALIRPITADINPY